MPISLALYGSNGHQVRPREGLSVLAGVAGLSPEECGTLKTKHPGCREFPTLDALLDDPEIQLVSLCSPRRADQAADALMALRAGKHVYAEKPAALTEEDLDLILKTAGENGVQFREMAGTAFSQPYFSMRRIVGEGRLGDIVQVIAEKSYPWFEGRAQDEEFDGGLIGQNAIHAVRLVEHVAGQRLRAISALETRHGNPDSSGGLRMAACLMGELENGGLASLSANYLNSKGSGVWGYESLRILGSRGFVESTLGGRHTRLVLGEEDCGPLPLDGPGIDYFEAYLKTLLGLGTMPLTSEEELRPLRWVLRAKKGVRLVR